MKNVLTTIAEYTAGAVITLSLISVYMLYERVPTGPQLPLFLLMIAPFIPLAVGFLLLATGRRRMGFGAIGMGLLSFILPWHLIFGTG